MKQYTILPREKGVILAECHKCHKRVDARGINGHIRQHKVTVIPSKLYLDGYRKGVEDTLKKAA